MKKYIILFLGFLVLVSCTKDEAQDTVKAYITAHNEHDVEMALSFYHQDIVFELKNTWIKKGVKEMRLLEAWDSTLNSNLTLKSLETRGDSVLCTVIENNDWFNNVGINDLVHDPAIFIIENNRIKKIIGHPSEETGKKIQASIGSIMQWSRETKDSTIYGLIPNGQFIYSSEAANQWLALFERWKSD